MREVIQGDLRYDSAWLVQGEPGVGKSTLAYQFALEAVVISSLFQGRPLTGLGEVTLDGGDLAAGRRSYRFRVVAEGGDPIWVWLSVIDDDGVYRKQGPARVFIRERDAIAAIKGQSDPPIKAGDVIVLIGRGPIGCGMEETYQITSALKYLSFGRKSR